MSIGASPRSARGGTVRARLRRSVTGVAAVSLLLVGPVVVVAGSGTSAGAAPRPALDRSKPAAFPLATPSPTISSVTPTTGPSTGGTTVTIRRRGLHGGDRGVLRHSAGDKLADRRHKDDEALGGRPRPAARHGECLHHHDTRQRHRSRRLHLLHPDTDDRLADTATRRHDRRDVGDHQGGPPDSDDRGHVRCSAGPHLPGDRDHQAGRRDPRPCRGHGRRHRGHHARHSRQSHSLHLLRSRAHRLLGHTVQRPYSSGTPWSRSGGRT